MSADKKIKVEFAKLQKLGASCLAISIFIAQVAPALATIDNTATVSGSYNSTAVTATAPKVSVPVVAAAGALTISAVMTAPTTSKGTDTTLVDASDTVDVTYTVTNSGNVTLNSVTPDPATFTMKFNGKTGTGTFGTVVPKTGTAPITLIPGASQDYVVTYTLSQLDVDRSAGLSGTTAVVTTASATAQTATVTPTTVTPATPASANTNVPAGPKISVAKGAALPGSQTSVKLGDIVTYTYTVINVGNVPLTTVSLDDQHGSPAAAIPLGATGIKSETLTTEGPLKAADNVASSDATANDGKWDTLQPGATVTFTYAHTVTQAEIDHG